MKKLFFLSWITLVLRKFFPGNFFVFFQIPQYIPLLILSVLPIYLSFSIWQISKKVLDQEKQKYMLYTLIPLLYIFLSSSIGWIVFSWVNEHSQLRIAHYVNLLSWVISGAFLLGVIGNLYWSKITLKGVDKLPAGDKDLRAQARFWKQLLLSLFEPIKNFWKINKPLSEEKTETKFNYKILIILAWTIGITCGWSMFGLLGWVGAFVAFWLIQKFGLQSWSHKGGSKILRWIYGLLLVCGLVLLVTGAYFLFLVIMHSWLSL